MDVRLDRSDFRMKAQSVRENIESLAFGLRLRLCPGFTRLSVLVVFRYKLFSHNSSFWDSH
jgi:hypothetical protein